MFDLSKGTSFENIILTILAIVVLLIIIGCIYTFIRAIFLFVFSWAKEENKKKWRNSIRFMIIGIILTIFLLLLFPTIFRLMNVPGYDKYTPQNVLNKAGEIVNWAFDLGNFIKKSQEENQYRGNLYYDTTPDSIDTSSNSDYNL